MDKSESVLGMEQKYLNTINLENGFKITFIYHSGFAVETPECSLLFDYYRGMVPEFAKEKPLYVFSSHRHSDHFNFAVFELAEKYPNIKYLLSNDIGKKYKKKYLLEKKKLSEEICQKITWMKEQECWSDERIEVRTILSTDIGVAFLVREKKTGKLIYHAGDLNWWTWEGETEEEYQGMSAKFHSAIADIKSLVKDPAFSEHGAVECAFLPLDPRQKEKYALGFDYFMRNVPVKYAFPMHAFGDYSVIPRLLEDNISLDYRDRVINLCGEKKKKVKILNPEVRKRIKEMMN